MRVLKDISLTILSFIFFANWTCTALSTEPRETDRPGWASAVVKALRGWEIEIIQCDRQPTVTVGQHKGYRLFLRQGHKVYDSPKTQVPTPPRPGDKFVMEYSYIDLVLFPSDINLPANIKEKIPWKDVKQKKLVKQLYMGRGMGYYWFARTAIFWQEDLRKELGLKDGEDRIQLLVDGIYVPRKDRVASGQVQLPWRLQYFGDKAIPYIKAAMKKNPDNYAGHEDVAFALGFIPSGGSTAILRRLYASEQTRLRLKSAKALLRQPYRKAAKREYLDMLRRQIPALSEAAEVCVEFWWREAIPLLDQILVNPHSWLMFPAAIKAKRELQARPVPEYVENILGLWKRTALPDQQELQQIKETIVDSADKEAAAVTAVYLALYASKLPTEQVNEVGREIFGELPVETTRKLLESLVQNFKDEPKYDMRRFKKLLRLLDEPKRSQTPAEVTMSST